MYTEHKLSNGIKVIMKKLDVYRSVSIGFWIKAGSINENVDNNGISHFIEHMLFKGTKSKTGKEISEIFDTIGGDLNAFTSKECTCYHARVLDKNLEIAISVISEMLINPLLSNEDIIKEKRVVLDEIDMAEDTPDDVSYDLIAKTVFGDNSLSRPILGTGENIENFDRDDLSEYMKEYYTSSNAVISIAGNFDEEETILMLEKYMKNFPKGKVYTNLDHNSFHSAYSHVKKDIEQVHLEIAYNGLTYESEEQFSLAALNNILGASVSSRLFQVIREDHGLTYSINSYISQYKSVGLLSVYASMNSENLLTVVSLIKEELDKIRLYGINAEEVSRVKEQLKGNYILDLEGSESFMNLIGKGKLFDKKIYTLDEIELKVSKVTKESITELIKKIIDNDNYSVAIVGKVDEKIAKKCYEILKK